MRQQLSPADEALLWIHTIDKSDIRLRCRRLTKWRQQEVACVSSIQKLPFFTVARVEFVLPFVF
jgi:hypothetical protein